MKPATHYLKNGPHNVAYQIFGTGPINLVYIPGWVSNIDLIWTQPELRGQLKALGEIARVIMFDKPGTGLSDRLGECYTLEERADDIRAVMDVTGCDDAILFGHWDGAVMAAKFAAMYPNRVISLITLGLFARRSYQPEYPWAPNDRDRQAIFHQIETRWGHDGKHYEVLAPYKAHDKEFMEWLAKYLRSSASPHDAMLLTKMNKELDIFNMLSEIRVPTLLLYRLQDSFINIEEGRFIAQKIRGAALTVLEQDHSYLFWGLTADVLKNVRTFIQPDGTPPEDLFLKNILQVIENHLSNEAFGVEMLCREAGISERQLQRKLKAMIKKSPGQLITSVRLHYAKQVLLGYQYTIAEAAFKTGFSNPSYFSKCFKREFGMCPSELLESTGRYGARSYRSQKRPSIPLTPPTYAMRSGL